MIEKHDHSDFIEGKYLFKDLVDIDQLRSMFESFSHATGFTTGLVSHPDQNMLIGTGFRDICTKFHRAFTVSETHCKQSNLELTSFLKERKELNVRHCESGLVDGATPIIIKGAHVANLFTGQIFFEEPDIDWFRKQGEKYGYEVDAYLEAVAAVPIVKEGEFKEALRFLSKMAVMIGEQGLTNLQNLEAARAIQESEQRLSIHLNNTPVGAVSWDLEFKAVDWNPAAEAIFGYTREEVIGKHVTELILPIEIKEVVDGVFQDLLSGRGGQQSINENITKTGRRILCDWYNTILKNIDGKVIGVASLVNDITERKKAQEMLIQSEKMMSIGGLAAGMAHEINNPLAGMMQNAQVIHKRLTKSFPQNDKVADEVGTSMTAIKNFMVKRDILKQLKSINEAGSRVAKIIENMLSFSRKSNSVRSEHNLEELIEKTLELAKNDYGLKKNYDFNQIKIIREYASKIPSVFCEGSKIQQVIFNIIKNASEAMGEEKQKNKKLKITLQPNKKSSMVCIAVEDNGPGMDIKTKKHIFEPFFTTKSVEQGTGLGLSVSYFIIVDDHDGEMEVESTLGKGTKFIIKLPVRS